MNNEFLARMKEMLGDEYPAYEASLEQPARRGFRVNPLKTDPDSLFSIVNLSREKSPYAKWGYWTEEERGIGFSPACLAGLFYMQEPSASSAVTVLDVKPGMKVADLCAAPGSKTTQIAEMLGNDGLLVANEYVAKRASILVENVEHHGAANVTILNSDTKDVADAFPEFFDALLCDAPCSGEGMFRKSSEAVDDWSAANVEMCAQRQREILANAYRCLKPGGTMVYSTCTFSLEENEKNMVWFTNTYPDMEIIDTGVSFGRPGFDLGNGTGKCIRIFPMDGGEGHFICRLHKLNRETSSVKVSMLKSQSVPKFVKETLDEILTLPYPYLYVHDHFVYGGCAPFYACGKCRIVRDQVLLGEIKKDRFEPSHHLAMSSFSRFRISVDLDDEQLKKYMHGDQLNIHADKGWCLLTWHGLAMGLGRSDGNVIKNKYPKGLRTR